MMKSRNHTSESYIFYEHSILIPQTQTASGNKRRDSDSGLWVKMVLLWEEKPTNKYEPERNGGCNVRQAIDNQQNFKEGEI